MSISISLFVRECWASLRGSKTFVSTVSACACLFIHSVSPKRLFQRRATSTTPGPHILPPLEGHGFSTRLNLGRFSTLCFACAAILLPVATLFGLVEAGFQISNAIHLKSPTSPYANVGSISYDPDLLYRPRNLPVPGSKEGRFRVIALGDSLIGGAPEHNLIDRLKNIVARSPELPPVEFVNAGVPGYTNYQELVFLKKFGLAMQPDAVAVVFCLNDVHRFLVDVNVVNGKFGRSGVRKEAAGATQGTLLRIARRSFFLRWLKDKTALAGAAVDMYESHGYDFDYRPDLSTAWQDSPWTMIRDQMREMTDLAARHQFRLFLVVVPFGEQYRKDYLARDARHVLKPQRTLGEITRTLGIPYLDLYPSLSKGSFVSDLIHLNEQGQERAAEKIAEFMEAEKLLGRMREHPSSELRLNPDR